ncbi:hypothetical protein I553_3801 [Mycobacterium xenopi 4042]|uniref:DUF4350 domain-containing protein n=1 Tax=Mycobacterium xenopi 4042 TaxID=1299334 RepID=X8EVR8_MYCXE|nr:hypothetical protein I553_3801 [Mycobacterium xenopi 4042]
MREANRAGSVQFGPSNTYTAEQPLTSCYDGVLVRYRDRARTVTVVGNTTFMTNGNLLRAGNAALAMNLAGARPRLIWYAPQHIEGEKSASATLFDLIPSKVDWIVIQLCVTVILLAAWKGRRLGPLVAEDLRSWCERPRPSRAAADCTGPDGRGIGPPRHCAPRRCIGCCPRRPRSPRARSRRGDSRRPAQPIESRIGAAHTFRPAPATDTDLVHLARALDDIERQVAHR